MDRNNHRMDTVLDAEYQPLDAQNLEPGRSRSMELLSALLLAVLGLTALAFPLAAGVSFAFFLTAALLLYGISQAAAFFLAAKELRSVWMLVSGVLLLLFAGLTLAGALRSELGVLRMLEMTAFFAAVLTSITGFSQISGVILLRRAGFSASGWMLVSGILNYLLSLLMFFNPIVSWFALTTVWGIYFLAAAVTLLFRHWSVRRGAHSRAS